MHNVDVVIPEGFEINEQRFPSYEGYSFDDAYQFKAATSNGDVEISFYSSSVNELFIPSNVDVTKDYVLNALMDSNYNHNLNFYVYNDNLVARDNREAYIISDVIVLDDYVIIPYVSVKLYSYSDEQGKVNLDDYLPQFEEVINGIYFYDAKFYHYTEGDIAQDIPINAKDGYIEYLTPYFSCS